MSRTRRLFTAIFRTTAILVGSCALVATAVGQTTSTELAADCSAYASIPLPTEAEKAPVPKTPPACASYRSYRGIRRPVNYSEARACAWQERLAQKADLGQNQEEPAAWIVRWLAHPRRYLFQRCRSQARHPASHALRLRVRGTNGNARGAGHRET